MLRPLVTMKKTRHLSALTQSGLTMNFAIKKENLQENGAKESKKDRMVSEEIAKETEDGTIIVEDDGITDAVEEAIVAVVVVDLDLEGVGIIAAVRVEDIEIGMEAVIVGITTGIEITTIVAIIITEEIINAIMKILEIAKVQIINAMMVNA